MKTKSLVFFFLLILSCSFALQAKEVESTLADQKEISVTVYNSNIALIRDLRTISLPKGGVELKFMDVPSLIKPKTVLVKSLNSPSAFSIIEQNYEYDLLSPDKLLDKFVGEKIKVITRNQSNNTEKETEAVLLSNNQGKIFQIGKEIRIDNPDAYIFPKIPENLISRPTLVWNLENESAKPHDLETTYLSDGLNWSADYVALLNRDDSLCDLSGWVTVVNQSGASYKNAVLKVVAGDLNRVYEDAGLMRRDEFQPLSAKAVRAPEFKEESLFEYHMYSLDRRTTIKNNETKQISLLNVSSVPIKKEFLYYGSRNYFRGSYGQTMSDQKVGAFVEIDNSKKNRLGIPLPKGTVRAYKADSSGSLQFVGEDSIDHTPKDEKIKIKLGNAFDIVAERKQTEYRVISDNRYSVGWQITLRNHKEEDITVGVIEPIWGDWKVTEKSHDFTKVDSNTLRFDVKVPKGGRTEISYKVSVKY